MPVSKYTPDTFSAGIVETSGPTALSVGAISDGQVLKRSGTTIIGAVPWLRETAGPTDLAIGAIADGQYLKRSGANVVGAGAVPILTLTADPRTGAGRAADVTTVGLHGANYYRKIGSGDTDWEAVALYQRTVVPAGGAASVAFTVAGELLGAVNFEINAVERAGAPDQVSLGFNAVGESSAGDYQSEVVYSTGGGAAGGTLANECFVGSTPANGGLHATGLICLRTGHVRYGHSSYTRGDASLHGESGFIWTDTATAVTGLTFYFAFSAGDTVAIWKPAGVML